MYDPAAMMPDSTGMGGTGVPEGGVSGVDEDTQVTNELINIITGLPLEVKKEMLTMLTEPTQPTEATAPATPEALMV